MTHTRSESIRISLSVFLLIGFLSAGVAFAQSTGGTPVDPNLNGANNTVGGAGTQDGGLNGPNNGVGGSATQDGGLNGANNTVGGAGTQDGGLNGPNNGIGQTGNDVGTNQGSNDLGQTGNDVGVNQGNNAIGQTGNDVGQTGNDVGQQGQMDPNLPIVPGVDQGLIGASIDPSLPLPGNGGQSIWQDLFQWLGYQIGQTISQIIGALFGGQTGTNSANPWGSAYGQNFAGDKDIRYDNTGTANLYGQGYAKGENNLYGQGYTKGENNLYGQGYTQGENNLYGQGYTKGENNLYGQQYAKGSSDSLFSIYGPSGLDKFFKFCWIAPGQQQCKQDSYFTDPKLTNNAVADPLANELAQYVGKQDDSLIKDKNGNLLSKTDTTLQFGSNIDASLKCSDLQLNSFRNIIAFILCIVQRALIPLVMTMALIVFLWGIINYFIIDKGDENRQKGKKFIIWAVIAFCVMLAFMGIIIFAQGTLGFQSDSRSIYPLFYYEPQAQ